MRNPNATDEELIVMYVHGDETALRALILRHQTKIFTSICLLVKDRALAEDIFQDTFVKVVCTLKKGQYEEKGKFVHWAMRIARNLIVDHHRRTAKMPTVTDSEGNDLFAMLPLADENGEDRIIRDEREAQVKALIQRLPEEQREVLLLRHYGKLSFKEIADLTGVNVNTALGRMRYALMNMRKLIEKHKLVL